MKICLLGPQIPNAAIPSIGPTIWLLYTDQGYNPEAWLVGFLIGCLLAWLFDLDATLEYNSRCESQSPSSKLISMICILKDLNHFIVGQVSEIHKPNSIISFSKQQE